MTVQSTWVKPAAPAVRCEPAPPPDDPGGGRPARSDARPPPAGGTVRSSGPPGAAGAREPTRGPRRGPGSAARRERVSWADKRKPTGGPVGSVSAEDRPAPSLLELKVLLAGAAHRTHPAVGEIFEGGAGGDPAVGITFRWIVHVAANRAHVLLHGAIIAQPLFFSSRKSPPRPRARQRR